jgi:putative pyrroloquinoline-quinone binding quinoprotein
MIDLGELGHEPVRARRESPSRRWLLIVPLAALLPLTGAMPAPSAPAPWTPRAVDVALAERSLYALTDPEQGWLLTRYDLPDGAVRWATPIGRREGPASVELAGPVPVVATIRDGGAVTTGYDPDTGRPRWSHGGWPSRALAATIVLHRQSSLAAVDLDTGRVTWTIPVDGSEHLMYGTRDLVLLGHGRLVRYELATGTAVASADLPAGRPYYPAVGGGMPSALFAQLRTSVYAGELSHPAVAGGLVMLTEPGGGAAVAAYDLATLAPRWRLPGYVWAASCGPVVCAVADDLYRLAGVDPRTGSVRWLWDCHDHGPPDRACYVLPSALGPAEPMLVQQWQLGQGGVDTAWLVDPETGAAVAELGQWRAVGRIEEASWLLRWVDEEEPIYSTRLPPERIWLGRLTVDPPLIQVLGSIETPAPAELIWLHARAGGGGRA